MNDQTKNERLEAVLDAFVASEGGPRSTSLAEWTHRYPEFARQLTEFAASWSLMRELPPSPDQEEVDQETLVLRGMSIVQDRRHTSAEPGFEPEVEEHNPQDDEDHVRRLIEHGFTDQATQGSIEFAGVEGD